MTKINSPLFLVMMFFQMIKGMNYILETIHIVSIDVPVTKVSVTLVLDVSDIIFHDVSGDITSNVDISF